MARKILLADDSVTAQNMGRKILTDAGYDVITVNNGSAALKRVTEQKPDLVVLDVYMPGYSGLEVCARLKDSPDTARIPILLTVGKLEPFKPEEATRVRADAFIVKPFEASELLSALTRLEDRMVPQAEGARFSTSVSGIERFSGDPAVKTSDSGDDNDTGWKNRLRFPSKKKKEPEPEPETDFVTPPSFRDLRHRGGKAPVAGATFPVNAASATGQEPGLVPDIPRDITPEELDALSALVAKLDGPIPAAENIAPLSEKLGAEETPAPAAEVKHAEVAEVPAQTTSEAETVAAPAEAKIDARASDVESGLAAPQASAPDMETGPASEPVPAAVEATPIEAAAPAMAPAETASAPVVQEPAPVDRNDEPRFASAASATPQITEDARAEVQEAKAADSETSASVEAPKMETAAPTEEPRVEESPKSEETLEPAPVAARAQPGAEPEVPAPSAEELAEALRLLTPSQTPGAPQTLAEAGAALVEELSRGAGGNRWMAEAVALSPEEASASLEAEMFRTFASGSPVNGDGPAGEANSRVGHEAEEAAEAAVVGAEVHAEAYSKVANESPAVEMTASATAPEKAEELPAKQAEKSPREDVAAVTFADAVRSEDSQSVSAKQNAEPVSSAATSSVTQEEVSDSEDGSGGQETMGKDTKGKGGKSNWHQIRSGAPAAAATDVVEAAKQTEDAPKTMAAAASADGASDASAIASIVDSVLADLRPKIVEEIAKKLGKK